MCFWILTFIAFLRSTCNMKLTFECTTNISKQLATAMVSSNEIQILPLTMKPYFLLPFIYIHIMKVTKIQTSNVKKMVVNDETTKSCHFSKNTNIYLECRVLFYHLIIVQPLITS